MSLLVVQEPVYVMDGSLSSNVVFVRVALRMVATLSVHSFAVSIAAYP